MNGIPVSRVPMKVSLSSPDNTRPEQKTGGLGITLTYAT